MLILVKEEVLCYVVVVAGMDEEVLFAGVVEELEAEHHLSVFGSY